MHDREPALRVDQRTHLLRETAAGFKLVFGSPVLRAIALLVFGAMLFTIVPEGIAAGWAGQLTSSTHDRGWIQGVIMMANPMGFVLGGLTIGRLVPPATRQRLIRPFALLAPLALVFAVLSPRVWGVAVISAACGFASAALIPATNGLFVQALPTAFRARAFGVMSSGVMLLQGAAVFATGALADLFQRVPLVVGFWGVGGTAIMLAVILAWPSADRVTAAIEEAKQANAATEAAAARAAARIRPTAPNGYVPRHAARGQRPVPDPVVVAPPPPVAPVAPVAPPPAVPPPVRPAPLTHEGQEPTLRAASA